MRCPEIFRCQAPLPAREAIAPKALCAKAPAMGGASLGAFFSVGGPRSRWLTGGSRRGTLGETRLTTCHHSRCWHNVCSFMGGLFVQATSFEIINKKTKYNGKDYWN